MLSRNQRNGSGWWLKSDLDGIDDAESIREIFISMIVMSNDWKMINRVDYLCFVRGILRLAAFWLQIVLKVHKTSLHWNLQFVAKLLMDMKAKWVTFCCLHRVSRPEPTPIAECRLSEDFDSVQIKWIHVIEFIFPVFSLFSLLSLKSGPCHFDLRLPVVNSISLELYG